MQNLDNYISFFVETQVKQRIHKHIRQNKKNNNNKIHKKYLAYIYANRISQDYERVKQALKKNLRYKQQQLILVDKFVANNKNNILELNLEFLLLYKLVIVRKMSYTYLCEKNLLILIIVIILQNILILI